MNPSYYSKGQNWIYRIKKTMGHHTLKVCKAPCFFDNPKLKTVKLRPNSKELGFKFMDIMKA